MTELTNPRVCSNGEVLFWYGIDTPDSAHKLMAEFQKNGRRMFGDINLESQLKRAADAAVRIRESGLAGKKAGQIGSRSYSTNARVSTSRSVHLTTKLV